MFSSITQNTLYRDSHHLTYGVKHSSAYRKIAQYIEQGFADTYSARINVNSPVLLAANNEHIQAGLGLRNASAPLFSEQYLDSDIVKHLSNIGLNTHRSELIEISSLYSNNRRMTVRLLSSLVLGLYQLGYNHLIFTATAPLLKLLHNFELHPTPIIAADPNKLQQSKECWGTYYETQPQVVVLEMAQCVQSLNLKQSMLGVVNFLPNEFEQFDAAIKGQRYAF